jgi:competence ComEA-like helix-hairpin-helix protein
MHFRSEIRLAPRSGAGLGSAGSQPATFLRARIGVLAALLLAAAFPSLAQKKPPAKPINLNTATLEQLEQLPGIGPVTAQDILDFRKKSGPFRSVNDLLAVRRITKARLEKLKPYITVGPATPPPAKKPSS